MIDPLWLTSTQPRELLGLLRGTSNVARTTIGRRKLRLFGVACCRRLPHLFTRDRLQAALAVAEQFANRTLTKADADTAANRVWWGSWLWKREERRVAVAARATLSNHIWTAALAGEWLLSPLLNDLRGTTIAAERTTQADLIRCLFGNGARRLSIPAEWRSSTVVALAVGIQAEGAFDRLPILADALEESSCDDVAMLSHARGPGPHAPGCWVVDLVLGSKSVYPQTRR